MSLIFLISLEITGIISKFVIDSKYIWKDSFSLCFTASPILFDY